MLLTEKEASEKRCTPIAVLRLMNRDERDALVANGVMAFNCIGSACMQWREVKKAEAFYGRPAQGYCGLAGKP